ncbi:MAG: SIR2 family protein [Syntrophaceae bacterium]|nr:SIR2 family protein [Syntrophaceae bacterium]
MNNMQDPYKQINNLQQCLSSDKRPLGFFIGAGCPLAVKMGEGKSTPIIPDIAGITEAVRTGLLKDEECEPIQKIVETHFKDDGRENTNVEDILSHIRALRVVAGKDKVRNLSAEDIDKLDSKICKIIHELVDKELPNTETPYHQVALWLEATIREKPVELFTTNYDLLMEQACEDYRVPYFDGFAGSRRPFFDIRAMEEDTLPPRWARLWKLHGSINWCQDPTKGVCRGLTSGPEIKRVIHPSHLKYDESRRMPYLAMMDRLRAFLKQPSVALVICGYSFRDDHINEVIIQGLQGTQTAVAFALLYDKIDGYSKAVRLARERRNLILLASDGGIISGNEAKWIERENDSVPSESHIGITWVPIDQKETDGKSKAELTLGDFSVLGQFLNDLVGRIRQSSEVSNVK